MPTYLFKVEYTFEAPDDLAARDEANRIPFATAPTMPNLSLQEIQAAKPPRKVKLLYPKEEMP